MGGWSGEREISLRSGKNVAKALKKTGCNVISIDVDKDIVDVLRKSGIDVAFITLHGPFGEDGGIQSILEMLEIPYTGSGVLASAIGMNKLMCKRVVSSVGVKTSPFFEVIDYETEMEIILKQIGSPCVIKPVNEGSSLGVVIAKSDAELHDLICNGTREYKNIFVEKFLKGREFTVGVLTSKYEEVVLPILELRPKNEFYDFEAKYTKGLTEFILPAELDEITTEKLKQQALLVHKTLGCKGATRSDFIITEKGEINFLEINTSPGMTDTSDVPAEADCMGIDMQELMIKILKSAF
jgi:D-alanine-D-alanine ligase